ncbi:MAG: transposase, partial [Myxococcales bacterium]|nr:transposase [Myxococcales bacterium]
KKTKNDYFREMLIEVLSWGLSPAWVTGDSWYSSVDNLKYIRKLNLNFMFGIENNRTVSVERGTYTQAQKLEDWPDSNEREVYLKDYGMVKLFRQMYKEAYRYYIMGVANLTNLEKVNFSDFEVVHAAHWHIEQFHRAIKQVCNIERFQVRKEKPVKNHIFCAIKAFSCLEFMRFDNEISHWYELKRDLFISTIGEFITGMTENLALVNA